MVLARVTVHAASSTRGRWRAVLRHVRNRNMQKWGICQETVGQCNHIMQNGPVQQSLPGRAHPLGIQLSFQENPLLGNRAQRELRRWSQNKAQKVTSPVAVATDVDDLTTLERDACLSCQCVGLLFVHLICACVLFWANLLPPKPLSF